MPRDPFLSYWIVHHFLIDYEHFTNEGQLALFYCVCGKYVSFHFVCFGRCRWHFCRLAQVPHFHRVTLADLFIYGLWAASWFSRCPSPCQQVEGIALGCWATDSVMGSVPGLVLCHPCVEMLPPSEASAHVTLCSARAAASPFKANSGMHLALLFP